MDFLLIATGATLCTKLGGMVTSALLVESLPPAMSTSASPRSIAAAARVVLSKLEVQALLTVYASTREGSLSSSTISRPTLTEEPPTMHAPQMQESMSSHFTGTRSSRPRTAAVPSSYELSRVKSVKARTKGVRTPPTITARRGFGVLVLPAVVLFALATVSVLSRVTRR